MEFLLRRSWRPTNFLRLASGASCFFHVLREEFGVAKEDRVAILAANSAEWIIAFWATISIGGVVASMNAMWAGPEIAHALANCEPTVLIADRERLARVLSQNSRASFRTIEVESEFEDLVARGRGAAISDLPIDEDDPPSSLYTIGTPDGRMRGRIAPIGCASYAQQVSAQSPPRPPLSESRLAPVWRRGGTRKSRDHGAALLKASGSTLRRGSSATGAPCVALRSIHDEDDVFSLIESNAVRVGPPRQHGTRVSSGHTVRPNLSIMQVLAWGGAPVSPAHQHNCVPRPERVDQRQHGYTSIEPSRW